MANGCRRQTAQLKKSHNHISNDSTRFWLDLSCRAALEYLISIEAYCGRILRVDQNDIHIEESIPPNVTTLPMHVCKNLSFYTEKECRGFCRQIALLLQRIHWKKTINRNLNLNNVLVNEKGAVVLSGFKYAHFTNDDEARTAWNGFRHPYDWYAFRAPEMESGAYYDESADLWSLGATIYMALTGLSPFRGKGQVLFENKHSGSVVFDVVIPSRSAQDLVRGLLKPDPKERLTIEEVLQHGWMTASDDILSDYDLALAQKFLMDWSKLAPYNAIPVRPDPSGIYFRPVIGRRC